MSEEHTHTYSPLHMHHIQTPTHMHLKRTHTSTHTPDLCPWLLQFLLHCEGTRFTPEKHRASMQVAQSKGLPSLKHHLLPRTRGFWVTVQNLRGTGEKPSQETDHHMNNHTFRQMAAVRIQGQRPYVGAHVVVI